MTPPPRYLSPTEALTSFVSASGTFAAGMWLLLPLAVGAMWWPMVGGIFVVVLAMSCWFRWFGIREIRRGFELGGIAEFRWLRIWQILNSINAGGGLAVAIGVVATSRTPPDEDRSVLIFMENAWFLLLVLELLIASRLISAVAAWLESTWVQVTQLIVSCLVLFSLLLHLAVRWMPAEAAESNAATLTRAAAILIAAAAGLIAIWWIGDGLTRMTLALADEVREEPLTRL